MNLKRSALDLAILVVSCDHYRDLWDPFFTLFKRFWPDCPYRTYLLSNYHEPHQEDVTPILVGPDYSWSSNLLKGLDSIHQDYVFMIIDDLFLTGYIPEDIQDIFAWVDKVRPNYLRLNPRPKPDKSYDKLVGIVSPGTLYRTATVMTIWKRSVLIDLLKPEETAWDFELYGSVRSDKYEGFYSTWNVTIPFINAVIKGKWRRPALRFLEAVGVNAKHDERSVMTVAETVWLDFYVMRNKFLECLPARYRRRIRQLCTFQSLN